MFSSQLRATVDNGNQFVASPAPIGHTDNVAGNCVSLYLAKGQADATLLRGPQASSRVLPGPAVPIDLAPAQQR